MDTSKFLIIPAIDVRGGKCVRLYQGDYAKETVYAEDPVCMAQAWEDAGAELIHVVDLDGARDGHSLNRKALVAIRKQVSCAIEFGGGLRTLDDISFLCDHGIDYGIVGTRAITQYGVDTEFLAQANALLDGKLVVGIDAKQGKVATDGWKTVSHMDAVPLAKSVEALGITRIIYTDILTDGAYTGPNIEAAHELLRHTDSLVITLSGGIASYAHIEAVFRCQEPRFFGVITGRALYDKKIKLHDAIVRIKAAQ